MLIAFGCWSHGVRGPKTVQLRACSEAVMPSPRSNSVLDGRRVGAKCHLTSQANFRRRAAAPGGEAQSSSSFASRKGSCEGGRLGLTLARRMPSMDAVNASDTSINARDVGEQVCSRNQPLILYGILFEECHAVGSPVCPGPVALQRSSVT